jgi:hypothetical protein
MKNKFYSLPFMLIVCFPLTFMGISITFVSSVWTQDNEIKDEENLEKTLRETARKEIKDPKKVEDFDKSWKKFDEYRKFWIDQSQNVKREKLTEEQEQLIQLLVKNTLGDESNHYNEFGYKNLKLGEKVDLQKYVPFSRESSLFLPGNVTPWMHNKNNDEHVLCDLKGRILCVHKNYPGRFANYMDNIIETFGKTTHEIKDNRITYNFPKVYVRVTIYEDRFDVSVIDRKWLEDELTDTLREQVRILDWCVKVLEKMPNITEENYTKILPPLPSTKAGYNSLASCVVYWLNKKLDYRFAEKKDAIVANIRINDLRICPTLCPNMTRVKLLHQMPVDRHSLDSISSILHACQRPLETTLFADLGEKAFLNLVQYYFPPKDGEYTIKSFSEKNRIRSVFYDNNESVDAFYFKDGTMEEWSTDEWTVQVRGSVYLGFFPVPKQKL